MCFQCNVRKHWTLLLTALKRIADAHMHWCLLVERGPDASVDHGSEKDCIMAKLGVQPM
jgi:hypothetical protein